MDTVMLKRLNPLQEVIAETLGVTLRGRGRYLKPDGEEGSSLVIDVDNQLYNWNAKGHAGDVISWLQHTQNMDFRQACEWLANRANMPLEWHDGDAQKWQAARAKEDMLSTIAVWLQTQLHNTPKALDWAQTRAWDPEALKKARAGYWSGNTRELASHLNMHHHDTAQDVAQAVFRMPPGSFVYIHYWAGRPTYLSARSISGKQHWNPPAKLFGDRQPYWNHAVGALTSYIVITEGQADALSLGEWNIPAVALAGTSANDQLHKQLAQFDTVYVAMDSDEAGNRAATELARRLGPLTRLVKWPGQGKDVNDWHQAGATEKEAKNILSKAATLVQTIASQVLQADPLQQDAIKRDALTLIAQLPAYEFADLRDDLAQRMGLSLRKLSAMLKALENEAKGQGEASKTELTVPNGTFDDHLVELIYKPGNERQAARTMLAVRYPNGELREVPRLETDNHIIKPLPPSSPLIENKVIRLPSAIGEQISDAELLGRVRQFIHKYVDLPESIELISSYYVMMTWLFDKFYVLPYLRARGQSDSGKSRFVETVGELCMRPIFISGSTTPSPIFRAMTAWGGLTIAMDEADLPHAETSADWSQMLNSGYKADFRILRTAMSNGQATVEAFSGFGPKVLNMRGRFPDDATESRCLTWETSSGRGVRDDIPRIITDRDAYRAEAMAIRNALLRFRLQNLADITIIYNHDEMKDLPGRLVEIVTPLLSISRNPEFKAGIMAFVEKENQKAINERATSIPAKIFEALLRARHLPDDTALRLEARIEYELEKKGEDTLRAQEMRWKIAHVTRQANNIVDRENEEARNNSDAEKSESKKSISMPWAGRIISDELNLEKDKSDLDTRPMIVLNNEENNRRIDALLRRYGMADLLLDIMGDKEQQGANQKHQEEVKTAEKTRLANQEAKKKNKAQQMELPK